MSSGKSFPATQTRYIPSSYNSVFDKGAKGYGYNFLYRSMVEIDPAVYGQVREALSDPSGELASRLPLDCLTALVDADFLIPSTRSELALIRRRYYRQLFGLNAVTLAILPTLSCDLTCPYCYVRKQPGIMKAKVADAIAEWIRRAFRPKRHLHVVWSGGEPLLAKRTIQRLTQSLADICRKWKAGYTAALMTNGYHLDREVIDQIEYWGLQSVQVTLDGDREHHDALRRPRRGGGSFDRIAENIERFCAASLQCHLVVRVNLTDGNYASAFELLEQFGPGVRGKARLMFAWVWPSAASGFLDLAPQGRKTDSFRRLDALYQAAIDCGWLTCNPGPPYVDGYCEVDSSHYFSIDPVGNLSLCNHACAAEAVGSVFQPGTGLNDDQVDFYDSWRSANPFGDLECRACRLLPVCWGGCRKARVSGGRPCIHERDAIELLAEVTVRDHLRSLARTDAHGGSSPPQADTPGGVQVLKAKYPRTL
jgi:uncharacterized protein